MNMRFGNPIIAETVLASKNREYSHFQLWKFRKFFVQNTCRTLSNILVFCALMHQTLKGGGSFAGFIFFSVGGTAALCSETNKEKWEKLYCFCDANSIAAQHGRIAMLSPRSHDPEHAGSPLDTNIVGQCVRPRG